MAGIDKIYLTDYNEYIYFRNFLEKHELEFLKNINIFYIIKTEVTL